MRSWLSSTLLGASLFLAVPAGAADPSPLKVSGAEAPRGAVQVGIASFNVGFIFESVDSIGTSGGVLAAVGPATKAKSRLTGVSPAMMQAVANGAYADFTAQMAQRGYQIVPAATLFANPALAKARASATPVNINIALEKGSKGQATFYKPTALPSQIILAGDFTGSGMSSMGLNMQGAQNMGAVANAARSAGVPIVNVTYLIDFSNQKRPGAFSFSGIKVNSGLSVAANYSRMLMTAPNGKTTTMTLKQAMAVEGDFIDMKDATSKTGATTQAIGNVAGGVAAVMGFGGLRFGKTKTFDFVAKPGNYEAGAIKATSLANSHIAAQLQAMR